MQTRKDFLLSIIREIGAFQMQHFGKEIEFQTKSNAMDFVSFIDIESQKIFVDGVNMHFPDDKVLGEEGFDPTIDYKNFSYCWVIDPVDGTLLYKRGLPFFGVMIALIQSGNVCLSAIYLPALGELYFADESGAYKNGEKVFVSTTNQLSTSVIHLPFYSIRNYFPDGNSYIEMLNTVGATIDVYSAAYSTIACASGLTDGGIFYPDLGNVWDTIPGAYLVQQSGGKVTTFGSDSWDIWSNKIIFSNGIIHDGLVNSLKIYGP